MRRCATFNTYSVRTLSGSRRVGSLWTQRAGEGSLSAAMRSAFAILVGWGLLAACGSGDSSGLGAGSGGVAGDGGSSGSGGSGGGRCSTSLDCPSARVCEVPSGRCVECVAASDCQPAETCLGNECRGLVVCASDNQCTSLGQLCNKPLGICVDCLDTSQCTDGKHCSGGGCVSRLCAEGERRCTGNTIETCAADGSGWVSVETCAGAANCQQSGSSASCTAWACSPESVYCQDQKVYECSADGLSASLTQDCVAAGSYCEGGACGLTACKPNKVSCDGKDVRRCDEAGAGTWLQQTCTAGEFCDASSSGCKPQWCEPGVPSCSGGLAAVCKNDGSGWEPGGQPCAHNGLGCLDGVCRECDAEVGVQGLRFIQVFLGKDDFVWVQNTSSVCSTNLQGLVLSVESTAAGGHAEFVLPALELAARGGVKIFEQGAVGEPGALRMGGVFAFQVNAGGAALLCRSAPCSASTVIDAVIWHQRPEWVPSSISFLPSPLGTIPTWQEESHVYARQQFSGRPATFYGPDWRIQSKTGN